MFWGQEYQLFISVPLPRFFTSFSFNLPLKWHLIHLESKKFQCSGVEATEEDREECGTGGWNEKLEIAIC